jgi:hypothetical protein
MSKWSVHGKIKVTALNLVATVCVPAKLNHVFTVGSLSCSQKSFGEVAKFIFWARTKLHKQVPQKMATLVYYATQSAKFISIIWCPCPHSDTLIFLMAFSLPTVFLSFHSVIDEYI